VKCFSVSAGEGRLHVTLDVSSTDGEGACAFLYGGDLPHVGGVALAAPGPEVHGEHLSSCDLWQVTVPGHKDVEAAALVARRLCKAIGAPVSVTCGVHVDAATPEDLSSLMQSFRELAEEAARCLVAAGGGGCWRR